MSVPRMRAYLGDRYVGRAIGAKVGLGGPSVFSEGYKPRPCLHVCLLQSVPLGPPFHYRVRFLCQGPLAPVGEELGVNC